MAQAKNITMDELLEQESINQLATAEVVEGKVLSVRKHELWIDLGPYGVGLVPRREIGGMRTLKEGDDVTASVVDPEIEEGYALLSLRKAAKDRGWDELKRIFDEGEVIEVAPYDANRGGMLIELEGIRGFMPVSQLSAEHYPRVAGADKDEILQRLNSLVNKPIKVRILDADRKTNKLIFSEKEAIKEGLAERFGKLKIGDVVKGVVTGVVDFGAFVNVDGIEGLIHISEISWERVNNPGDYIKVGDNVEAKIIAIDKDRLSLSLKQMQEDPWAKEVEKFKKGEEVEGTVTRITPFGAFIQLSPAVEALVHVTELGEGEGIDPEKIFKLNEKKTFKILEIDKENRKISLSLKNK
ncbi:MAG TPA: S1 RNA-binding domain-containing protein [Candidatus Saccharimonadales bacterium]|nr:S1 RNA-binding domain-containing protein [Candidatus Saccharimonadales bacterium]